MKAMPKPPSVIAFDVLVLGDHPSAYLAATLLKHKAKLRVGHAELESPDSDDRLVTINPALFDLHPLLSGMGRKLPTTGVYGIRFLADQPDTSSESRGKSAVVCTAKYKEVRDRMEKLAETEGVEFFGAKPLQIHGVDETGVDLTVGKQRMRATALVVAGQLAREQRAMLGMPSGWDPETMHRFTSLRCKTVKHLKLPGRSAMPMSLDLCGKLCWGWLLPGDGEFQLTVEQSIGGSLPADAGVQLLRHWITVLKSHGVLDAKFNFADSAAASVDLPLAGALAHEGVGNRTLMIGPAGGFYSACGEDVYPGCWSAIFAADVLKKALREPHLQDALNPFRQKWRTTLGDYLRGPHQNLRFLLPLVYRNPAMTSRLTEAILLSKSVVR
jgi:hypothetical protein